MTTDVHDGMVSRRNGEPTAIPEYARHRIFAIWASAALPMGLLAWVAAPALATSFTGPAALPRALILTLTAGLLWQFALVLAVLRREQGTLRSVTGVPR